MSKSANRGPIYGTHELTKALGISPNTLKSWRRRGKLPEPAAVLERGWVWQGEDVEEFIKQHRAKGEK